MFASICYGQVDHYGVIARKNADPLMRGNINTGYNYAGMIELKDTLIAMSANAYMVHTLGTSDWDSLRVLLPIAQANGIDMWVLLNTYDSNVHEPYLSDYILKADTIAQLSLVYSTLKGYSIDDMWGSFGTGTFTVDHIDSMLIRSKSINPNLLFYPITYFGQIDAPYIIGDFANDMDGLFASYPKDSLGIEYALLKAVPHTRASVSLPVSTSTDIGDFGRVYKTATVTNADSITLTFHYTDDYGGATSGYHFIELAIDSTFGDNVIPDSASTFDTGGITWWSPISCTQSWTEQAMKDTNDGAYTIGITSSAVFTAGILYDITLKAKAVGISGRGFYFTDGGGFDWTSIANPNFTTEYQDYHATVISDYTYLQLYISLADVVGSFTVDNIVIKPSGVNRVWSTEAAGADDSTITIDLKSSVTGRNSFDVNLGIYEEDAVGNLPIAGYFSFVSGYGITIDSDLTTWADTVKGGDFTVTQGAVVGKALPLIILMPGAESLYTDFYPDASSNLLSRLNTISNFLPRIRGIIGFWIDHSNAAFYDVFKQVYIDNE